MSECSTPTTWFGWFIWVSQFGRDVVVLLFVGALALDLWEKRRRG